MLMLFHAKGKNPLPFIQVSLKLWLHNVLAHFCISPLQKVKHFIVNITLAVQVLPKKQMLTFGHLP